MTVTPIRDLEDSFGCQSSLNSPSSSKTESPKHSSVKRESSIKKDHSIVKLKRMNSKKIERDHRTFHIAKQNLSENQQQLAPINIKQKRVEIISDLRKIHECLMKVFKSPKSSIQLSPNGTLEVVSTEEMALTHEMSLLTVEYIYRRILRAMVSQIPYFFDDRGHLVNLRELHKLAERNSHKNQSALVEEVKSELMSFYEDKPFVLWGEDVEDEYAYIEKLQNLSFPKVFENGDLTDNQKKCIAIFQRLYLLKAPEDEQTNEIPVMAPITFLCTYKKLISTEELFEQALNVLRLPETLMPYLQKLEVLNFIRLFMDSHLYDQDLNKSIFRYVSEIKKVVFETKRQELIDLALEIEVLLDKKEVNFLSPMRKESIRPIYEIDTLLSSKISKIQNYPQFIHSLSDDIVYISSEAFLTVTQNDLFSEKESNETDLLYNQIVDFTVSHFIKSFEVDLKGGVNTRKLKEKLSNFFQLFIDLGYELMQKRDYLSACAIYNALNISEINSLLSFVETKQAFSKGKRSSLMISNLTEDKFKEMNELFSLHRNFENLRKKMKECEDQHLPYIPLLAPYKNKMIHRMEMIESAFMEEAHIKIHHKKLQLIAEEVWSINQMLLNIKSDLKGDKMSLKTDIGYHLISSGSYDEKILGEISTKLKLSLT